MRVRNLIVGFCGLLAILMLLPERASAYIDPGSGALLWQTMLAAFFGGLFYFRRFLMRLAKLVKRVRE